MADFAWSQASDQEPLLADTYRSTVASALTPFGLENAGEWETLRFYGSLSPVDRRRLLSAERLGFTSLSPPQTEALRRLLFSDASFYELESAHRPRLSEMDNICGPRFRPVETYLDEPTEVLSGGLPPNGFLEVKQSLRPAFTRRVAESSGERPGTFGLSTLALFASTLESLPLGRQQELVSSQGLSDLALCEERLFTVTFHVAPGIVLRKTLVETLAGTDRRRVSVQNLPADLQQLVEDRRRQLNLPAASSTPTTPNQTPRP